MKNDTHPYRRWRFKKSCKGNWYWQYHPEQWINTFKILMGIRWPCSRVPPILGFIVEDGLVHVRRLNGSADTWHQSYEAKSPTCCGRKGKCRKCYSLSRPEGTMCQICQWSMEMMMDPVECKRQEAIRRSVNAEKRKEKQERRRARKLELANANHQ